MFDKLSLMTGLEVIEKSIELAPVLCKIFERIVNDRITVYIFLPRYLTFAYCRI